MSLTRILTDFYIEKTEHHQTGQIQHFAAYRSKYFYHSSSLFFDIVRGERVGGVTKLKVIKKDNSRKCFVRGTGTSLPAKRKAFDLFFLLASSSDIFLFLINLFSPKNFAALGHCLVCLFGNPALLQTVKQVKFELFS